MSNRPKSDWFTDVSGKDKEELTYVLQNNPTLIQAFLKILDRMEKEEGRHETSVSEYDSPSWAYKQADRNGAKRIISKVRALFTI